MNFFVGAKGKTSYGKDFEVIRIDEVFFDVKEDRVMLKDVLILVKLNNTLVNVSASSFANDITIGFD